MILEHPQHERARIMMPQKPLDEPVLPHHSVMVQAILTTHGIAPRPDPSGVLATMLENGTPSSRK